MAVALAVAGLVASTSALGRSAVDDLNLRIGSQIQTGPGPVYVISSLAFPLEFVVGTDGGPQTITLRYSLPAGLSFTTAPSTAEGCQAGPPVVCQLSPVTNDAGSMEWRKTWGVQAAAPGTYEVTATVEGSLPDPATANNTNTFRFEVRASGGGGGGGGGGSVSVSASAVKLTPAKPKAGSVVIASSVVKADGDSVKPSKISCSGTLAGKKLIGKGTAAVGKASCRYATPRSAKGKKLAGAMVITAKGKTVTRRFATRLR